MPTLGLHEGDAKGNQAGAVADVLGFVGVGLFEAFEEGL